ncbi:MAG: sortase [Clostridia bacterium]|nr:sortase [Clostridia bacterium]
MNQIIDKGHFKPDNNFHIEIGNAISEIPYIETIPKASKLKQYFIKQKYRFQFFVSLFVAIIFIAIFFYHVQTNKAQEKLSKDLLKNYSLTTLYHEKNLDSTKTNKSNFVIENPFVIGMIKIAKINLNYPILSESNSDLLKISLCRFAGPMPNEVGNLCIAGHNYVDNKFFSRLAELNKNDTIEIYDLAGKKITYFVTDKYEVNPSDLSCTNQDTNQSKVITLLTCNNVNGKRTVVKAIEK